MAIDQGPDPDVERWERLHRNKDVQWYVDRLRKLVTETKDELSSDLTGQDDWQTKYHRGVARKEILERLVTELARRGSR